jgi:hypothetical protein
MGTERAQTVSCNLRHVTRDTLRHSTALHASALLSPTQGGQPEMLLAAYSQPRQTRLLRDEKRVTLDSLSCWMFRNLALAREHALVFLDHEFNFLPNSVLKV